MNHNIYPKKDKKDVDRVNKGKRISGYEKVYNKKEKDKLVSDTILSTITEEPEIIECSDSEYSSPPRIEVIIGPTGQQGLQGIIGQTGPNGQKGQTGLEGPPGIDGCDGQRGPLGTVGDSGPGTPGPFGVTGPVGPRGGGTGMVVCDLRNQSDMITSVNVCTDEIIREVADQYELLTGSGLPCLDPFNPGNTGGVNMEYFDTQTGAFRAGNFRASDLTNIGDYSAAFGHWTRASGIGSMAFGYNSTNDTIEAGGDGSLAYGHAETDGKIKTFSGAIASVASGVASNGGIIQIVNGNASYANGIAINDGLIQADGDGSMITGVVSDSGSVIMTSANTSTSNIHGMATNKGTIIVDTGSIGANVSGMVQDPDSTIKVSTNTVSAKVNGVATNGGQMIIGTGSIGSQVKGTVDGADSIIATGNNTIGVKLKGVAVDSAQIITGNSAISANMSGVASGIGSILKAGSSTIAATVKGVAQESGQIIVDKNSTASTAKGMVSGQNSMIITTTKTIASKAEGAATNGGQIIVDAGAIASSAQGMVDGVGSMIMTEYFTTSSSVHGQATNGAQMVVDQYAISSSVKGSADTQSMMLAGPNTVGSLVTGVATNQSLMMVDTGSIASNIRGIARTSARISTASSTIGSSITGHAMENAHIIVDSNSIGAHIEGTVGNTGSIMMISNNTIGSTISGGATDSGMIMVDSNTVGTIITGEAGNTGSIIMAGKNTVGGNIHGMATNGGMMVINTDTIGSHIGGHAEMNGLLTVTSNAIGSSVAGFVSNGTTGPIGNFNRANPFESKFSARNCQVATIEAGGCGSSSKGSAIGQKSLIMVDPDTSGSHASGMAYEGGIVRVQSNANGSYASGSVNSATCNNGNSMILVESNIEGGHATGYAYGGGVVMLGEKSNGSTIAGLAYENEKHMIMGGATGGEGSTNFGRNNSVTTNYSLVIGCGTQSDTFCSVVQSSGTDANFANNIRNVLSADSYGVNFVLGTGLVPTLVRPAFCNGELDVIGSNGNYIAQKFTVCLDPITLLYTISLGVVLITSGITLNTGGPTLNGIELFVVNPGGNPPEKFCAKIELTTGIGNGPTGAQGPPGPTGPTGPTGSTGAPGHKQWDIQNVSQINWWQQPLSEFIYLGTIFGYPTRSIFDGTYLWTPDDNGLGGQVVVMDPTTGQIIQTITGYFSGGFLGSATFDGSHVWIADTYAGTVVGLNLDGSLFINIPGFGNPLYGAFDGIHIWLTDIANNSVWRFDAATGGNVMQFGTGGSAPYNLNNPQDIVFDGTNLWISNNGNNSIVEISTSGVYLQTLSGVPYNWNSPQGMAFDGTNIWVADSGNSQIQVFDTSGSLTPFSPISLPAQPYAVECAGLNTWVTLSNNTVAILRGSNGTIVRTLSGEAYIPTYYVPSLEYLTYCGTYMVMSDTSSLMRIFV